MVATAWVQICERALQIFLDLGLGPCSRGAGFIPGIRRGSHSNNGRAQNVVGGRRVLHLLRKRADALEFALPVGANRYLSAAIALAAPSSIVSSRFTHSSTT